MDPKNTPNQAPRQSPRTKIVLSVLALLNAACWIIPSDVVSLIVRNRHVLLGRYSREHMTLNLVVLVITLIAVYLETPNPRKKRRRTFQVAALAVFGIPALLITDFLLRTSQPEYYIRDSLAYHRPTDTAFTVSYTDEPQAARSWPNRKPGYPTLKCDYHTDARGFRNARTRSSCDIVVLGDSFAEGSKVPNDAPWPVLLEKRTGRSVVNLGMSGYAPAHYVAALTEFGLAISPHHVICMIYEGNDFRAGNPQSGAESESISKRIKRYFKQSPIRTHLDDLLIRTLGPVGAERPVANDQAISWLPLGLPDGPAAKYYAFDPKQITGLCVDSTAFAAGKVWANVRRALDALAQKSSAAGADLTIVYAPTKAHVLLPLVKSRLKADQLRAFVALRQEKLPPPDVFFKTVFDRLDTKRNLVARWCNDNNVRFIDPAPALARAAQAGTQVYFTYDQHWTPEGHALVAGVIADALPPNKIAEKTLRK